jgi:hypothetical protein
MFYFILTGIASFFWGLWLGWHLGRIKEKHNQAVSEFWRQK